MTLLADTAVKRSRRIPALNYRAIAPFPTIHRRAAA
jgi:hypothetical protein